MFDPDAPYPSLDDPQHAFLHWIQENNNDVIPYRPPNPPKDSIPHRYVIVAYNGSLAPYVHKDDKIIDIANLLNKIQDLDWSVFLAGHEGSCLSENKTKTCWDEKGNQATQKFYRRDLETTKHLELINCVMQHLPIDFFHNFSYQDILLNLDDMSNADLNFLNLMLYKCKVGL
jgi:hypothetical protein